jgi:hypothetical protein
VCCPDLDHLVSPWRSNTSLWLSMLMLTDSA